MKKDYILEGYIKIPFIAVVEGETKEAAAREFASSASEYMETQGDKYEVVVEKMFEEN